jgi:hypothetical protein
VNGGAGGEPSRSHDPDFFAQYSTTVRDDFSSMHRSGDTWSHQKLVNIFTEGLLQVYIYAVFKVRDDCNYQDIYENSTTWDLNTRQKLESKYPHLQSKDPKIWLELVNRLEKIAERIKNNKALLNLGGRFQRNKVITEKQKLAMEKKGDSSKQAWEEVYAQDRKTMDQQYMIYYWIVFIRDKFTELQLDPTPEDFQAFLEKIPNIKPDFLSHPYWEQLTRS